MRSQTWMERVEDAFKALPRKAQRRLIQDALSSPDARYQMRCKIIRNLVRGERAVRIVEFLGGSESQVYRVAKRFVDQGLKGLGDRREDNGEEKVTEEYVCLLWSLVEQIPQDYGFDRPTWTQELFAKVLAEQTDISISLSTICRLLKRLGIRLGMPKPIVGCPWPKCRKTRRLNEIIRLIANASEDEIILYVDEVDIHLNPKIGPDYMLPGTQKTVLTPGKNQKMYLAGALNVRTGRLTWVEYERKNSDLFIKQLWQLIAKDYPKAKKIHLILDNYRIHKSKRTQLALDSAGGVFELHFLPPYCPDHNKIERVWRDIHANVTRNHRCKSMKQLMRNVNNYLRRKDQKLQTQYQKRVAA